MKKVLKSNIFWFLFGALIFGMIGGVSAVTLLSKDISYQPKGDWNVSNVEQAIDSLYTSKASDNYSEQEKIIGTWVDGKPIYQLTILFSQYYGNGDNILVSNFLSTYNVDRVIAISGMLKSVGGDWQNFYGPGDQAYVVISSNGALSLYIRGTGSTWQPAVVIEYTKN